MEDSNALAETMAAPSEPGTHPRARGGDHDSLVGSRLDHFQIESLLGRGGMGEVYRADDLKLGQPVAPLWMPETVLAGDQA